MLHTRSTTSNTTIHTTISTLAEALSGPAIPPDVSRVCILKLLTYILTMPEELQDLNFCVSAFSLDPPCLRSIVLELISSSSCTVKQAVDKVLRLLLTPVADHDDKNDHFIATTRKLPDETFWDFYQRLNQLQLGANLSRNTKTTRRIGKAVADVLPSRSLRMQLNAYLRNNELWKDEEVVDGVVNEPKGPLLVEHMLINSDRILKRTEMEEKSSEESSSTHVDRGRNVERQHNRRQYREHRRRRERDGHSRSRHSRSERTHRYRHHRHHSPDVASSSSRGHRHSRHDDKNRTDDRTRGTRDTREESIPSIARGESESARNSFDRRSNHNDHNRSNTDNANNSQQPSILPFPPFCPPPPSLPPSSTNMSQIANGIPPPVHHNTRSYINHYLSHTYVPKVPPPPAPTSLRADAPSFNPSPILRPSPTPERRDST